MTNLPQKNVNSIQFGKEIVHVNHVFVPGSPILKGKKPRGLFFFSRSQKHRETSELRNSSELPRKFPEIFGNSRIIFGNSGTRQEKISRLWLRKSWQVYCYVTCGPVVSIRTEIKTNEVATVEQKKITRQTQDRCREVTHFLFCNIRVSFSFITARTASSC